MKHGHHSPAMRFLWKFTWFVTALTSILVGLLPLGFNVLELEIFKTTLAPYTTFILYAVGAIGVLSMISLFTCRGNETEHKSR